MQSPWGGYLTSPVKSLNAGTLPFLAAQTLRPVLGGQHQAETLLLGVAQVQVVGWWEIIEFMSNPDT